MTACDQGSISPTGSQDQFAGNRGSDDLAHETVDMGRSKCFGDRPVVQTYQCQKTNFKLYVMDRNGAAVDLSTGSFTVKFIIKDREVSSLPIFNVTCEITDAAQGIVLAKLTPTQTRFAGIFVAQVQVFNAADDLIWNTPYWAVFNPSLNVTSTGPITIPEVRLILRDSCPEQNFLLDDFEFNDSQIVACMRLPIDEFNEKYQPKTTYSPRTFPWRFHWLRATAGYLMEIAARGYARDHLNYVAGGVTVSDRDKAKIYVELANQLLADWRQFVKERKIEMNIEGGFGTMGSGYTYSTRW